MSLSTIELGRADTVDAVVRRWALTAPDATAIVATGYAPMSYADLSATISRAATCFTKAGLTRGSRVLVALPHGPVGAIAVLATLSSAAAVPIDPRLTKHEFSDRQSRLDAAAILLGEGDASFFREEAMQRQLPVIEVARVEDGKLDLDFALVEGARRLNTSSEHQSAPIAFVLQTSGTTGRPKLIPFSHSNMLATAQRVGMWFDLSSKDRCLCVSPIHYCHGLTVTFLSPLISGGSVAFPKTATEVNLPEWFNDLRPNWTTNGPTL
jgi:acyl-CoA synthetase (AMP-forming)/AMP-acid ligase II